MAGLSGSLASGISNAKLAELYALVKDGSMTLADAMRKLEIDKKISEKTARRLLLNEYGLELAAGGGITETTRRSTEPRMREMKLAPMLPRLRPARLLLSLVVGSLLGTSGHFLLRAFVPDNPGTASDNRKLVATLPVGPEGAKTDLNGGGSIAVPSGALDKPTTINVHKRPVEQQLTLASPPGGTPLTFPPGALYVYELTPSNTVLLRPIELTLPIPAGQNVAVFVTANGQARTLPGAVTGGTVRMSVKNFDFSRLDAVALAR